MSALPELTIGRLRLRDGGTSAARRRRARLALESVDPDPPGPPAEILILRRLADPDPGALGEDARRWRRAYAAAVAAARARAARPAFGPVPPDADAVRFADAAEALACLAEDVAASRAGALWWWRDFPAARSGDAAESPEAGLEAALSRRPELLPAALALLARRRSARRVLSRLGPAAALRLARLVGAAPEPPPAEPAPPGDGAPAGPRAASPATGGAAPAGDARRDPVERLVAAAGLLAERPGLPATALGREVSRRLAGPPAVSPPAAPPPVAGSGVPPPRTIDERGGASPPAVEGAEARAGGAAPERPEPASSAPPAKPGERAEEARPPPDAPPADPFAGDSFADPAPREATAGGPAEAEAAETGVATARAGAFFLVNLLDGRDRFALAPPEAPGWALLDLLARALLGGAAAPEDPLWPLLARLDGRENGAPPDAALWPGLPLLAPALRRDLAGAMGTGPEEDPADILLALPGRVFVAPAHLDVVFAMDDLRLPVRRAGLDLDPGWSPRFGRVIAFHYRDRETLR